MLTPAQVTRWQLLAPADTGFRQLEALAAERGTPLFVYATGHIRERVLTLRETLPAELGLLYSLKANPQVGVARLIAGLADGFDVASKGEIELALASGLEGAALSFTGPGKSDAELAAALACGALVVLESLDEARRLASLAGEVARTRVALRVNPPFELAAESRMGGGPRKFGVDSEIAGEVLAEIGRLGLGFEGLHVYPGSNCLDAGAIAQAQRATLKLACELAPLAPSPIRRLNLGGGFGVPFSPGEAPLDLPTLAASMPDLLADAARRLPEARLCLELGRFLVAEAGVYVARVLERKISRGRCYLILDGGMNHHWYATGALEHRPGRHFPMWIAGAGERPLETVTVCGPLCAPNDTWAENVALPRARTGDLMVVFQSGAYGPSASPAGFLGRPAAAEMLV